MESLDLAEMITAIKDEIQKTVKEQANREKIFGLCQMELEIKFTVAKKIQGKGGAKIFSVVTLNAGADYGQEKTHSVKLTFIILDDKWKNSNSIPLTTTELDREDVPITIEQDGNRVMPMGMKIGINPGRGFFEKIRKKLPKNIFWGAK
jgi:hypothetical protein